MSALDEEEKAPRFDDVPEVVAHSLDEEDQPILCGCTENAGGCVVN